MDDKEKRIIRFGELNLLGKTVFLAGAAVRVTASLIDTALVRAADLVVDTEKAFREGRDPNIEEAKILEERHRSSDPRPHDRAG